MLPTTTEPPSFQDLFALNLATKLLGTDTVLEHIQKITDSVNNNGGDGDDTSTIYWQSKLLLKDPSVLTQNKVIPSDVDLSSSSSSSSSSPSSLNVVFMDITFDFVKTEGGNEESTPSTQVLASFGFCIAVSSNQSTPSSSSSSSSVTGQYIRTYPLDGERLENHIESLNLCRGSVEPHKLAGIMAKELLRQGLPPSALLTSVSSDGKMTLETIASSNDNNDVLIMSIPYLNEGPNTVGTFSLTKDNSNSTTFDGVTLRLICRDLIQNNHHCTTVNDDLSVDSEGTKQAQEVQKAFDKWRKRPFSKASTIVNNTDNDKGSNSSNSKNKNIVAKRRRGLDALPSTRRKRNKGLEYD
jgi:hypothetical protein